MPLEVVSSKGKLSFGIMLRWCGIVTLISIWITSSDAELQIGKQQKVKLFHRNIAENSSIPNSPPYTLGHKSHNIHNNDNRIVGGKETTIEEHPYQVSFIVNQSYFCGGFIISENYIMTAAHCAQDVDPSTVVLRAGSTFRTNGSIIPIGQVTPHPDYDNPHFDNDIALMRTVNPIEFSDTIQAIPLPPKGRPMHGGTDITVSGWGRTKQGASTIPERLMEVTIGVVRFTQCRLVYPDVLTYRMFCGGNFFLGGQSTCQGDSGGAAIQEGMAVGIVSFGRGCGQPLSPSVFANIAELRDWVTEQTGI